MQTGPKFRTVSPLVPGWRLKWHGRCLLAMADQAAVQLGDAPGTAQLHGHAQFAGQDVDAVADASFARGGQPVQVGTPDQDGLSAQGKRGGDIAATAEPRVDQDLQVVPGRVDDLGKHVDGGRR